MLSERGRDINPAYTGLSSIPHVHSGTDLLNAAWQVCPALTSSLNTRIQQDVTVFDLDSPCVNSRNQNN